MSWVLLYKFQAMRFLLKKETEILTSRQSHSLNMKDLNLPPTPCEKRETMKREKWILNSFIRFSILYFRPAFTRDRIRSRYFRYRRHNLSQCLLISTSAASRRVNGMKHLVLVDLQQKVGYNCFSMWIQHSIKVIFEILLWTRILRTEHFDVQLTLSL